MSERAPINLVEWGSVVLRPARERAKLTRTQLAQISSVAESTLRNIELGRHMPTMRSLVRLCPVVGVINPLGDPEGLSIPLDGVPRDRAVHLLRCALVEFLGLRADPDAFASARYPAGILQIEAAQEAIADSEDVGTLLLALRKQERARES